MHKNAQIQKQKKELYIAEALKESCTFSPKIIKYERNPRKENMTEFINRLVNSKKIKTYKPQKFRRNYSDLEGTSSEFLRNSTIHSFFNTAQNNDNLSKKLIETKNLTKEYNTEKSTYIISNEDQISKHSSRKYLNSSN